MDFVALFSAEFTREAATTRKHLERLPDDKFAFKPHDKSETAGGLASHLVLVTGFAQAIITADELNLDLSSWRPFMATNSAELLAEFDRTVEEGKRAIAALSTGDLEKSWTFLIGGKPRFTRPRVEVLRDFCMSHLIHHRGQFNVYLRLLDVAVPGAYGPSADDRLGVNS